MKTSGLSLRQFVTPKLLGLWWWVNVALVGIILSFLLLGQLGLRLHGLPEWWFSSFAGWQAVSTALVSLGGLVALRIMLEFLAIIFSIYDRLLDICEKLDHQPDNSHPLYASPTPRPPQFVYRGARKDY